MFCFCFTLVGFLVCFTSFMTSFNETFKQTRRGGEGKGQITEQKQELLQTFLPFLEIMMGWLDVYPF